MRHLQHTLPCYIFIIEHLHYQKLHTGHQTQWTFYRWKCHIIISLHERRCKLCLLEHSFHNLVLTVVSMIKIWLSTFSLMEYGHFLRKNLKKTFCNKPTQYFIKKCLLVTKFEENGKCRIFIRFRSKGLNYFHKNIVVVVIDQNCKYTFH